MFFKILIITKFKYSSSFIKNRDENVKTDQAKSLKNYCGSSFEIWQTISRSHRDHNTSTINTSQPFEGQLQIPKLFRKPQCQENAHNLLPHFKAQFLEQKICRAPACPHTARKHRNQF